MNTKLIQVSPSAIVVSTSDLGTRAGFNLYQLVREVLAESDETDPTALATEVLERIPRKHSRDALAQVLHRVVGDMIRHSRNMHGTPPKANPSSKVAGIREYAEAWRRRLRDRWHVGDGVYKFTEDLTHADFLAIAEERRRIAAENEGVAEWAEKRAAELEEAGVERFGDLPEKAQAEALGAAA